MSFRSTSLDGLEQLGQPIDRRLTLKARVALRLALILFPICLLAGIAQYGNSLHIRALNEGAAAARGEALFARQRSALNEIGIFLETLSTLLAKSVDDPARCEEMLRTVLQSNPKVMSLRLLTPDGKTVCRVSTLPSSLDLSATPPWFKTSMEAPEFILHAPEVAAAERGQPADQPGELIATLPVYDTARRGVGMLAARVPSRVFSLPIEEVELQESSAMAIIDLKSRILVQQSKGMPLEGWIPAGITSSERTTGTFIKRGADGARRVYVTAALPGNLIGIYAQDPDEQSRDMHIILYLLLLFPLLIWVAASLFAGWATDHMIIEPLNKVRQAIRRYIAGDDTARIERDPAAPVEVQAVATKFNALAETIHARNDALRASLDYQKALVREINHRVRNNLQVMNSLLSLQSRRARTPEQATIFLDVQRRLNALGIVHTAFYQGDDFRSIDLCTLLRDLCQSSEQQFSNEWGSPIITMRCPTQIFALPDAALTLAFLVTELIAEVAAQASPNDYSGTRFDFELLPNPEGGSILTMAVDRPVLAGLMENSPDESHIKLFRGLIRQLRAKMDVNEENGIVTVTLPPLI